MRPTCDFAELHWTDGYWRGEFLPTVQGFRRIRLFVTSGNGAISQAQMDYVNKVLQYIDVFTYKAAKHLEEHRVTVRGGILNIDLHPTTLFFDADNSVLIYFSILNGPGAFVRCIDNEAVSHETESVEAWW